LEDFKDTKFKNDFIYDKWPMETALAFDEHYARSLGEVFDPENDVHLKLACGKMYT